MCGELADIRLLKQQLDLFDSPPLRQTSAAAILLLSALENDALSQASLRWARTAMGDSNLTTRLAAIAALGHSQQTDSLLLLAQALRDPSPAVRQGAIRALAQRRSEAALRLMRRALQDANSEVRQATLHAIVAVLRSFGPEGMGGLLAEALGWIAQTAQGTPESWVVAARTALGDTGRTEALAQLQATSDLRVQLWLIELGLVSHDALLRGTANLDSQLALAAARALAKQDPTGARDAILQVANRLQAQGGRSLLDAAALQLSVGDAGRAVAMLQDAAHSADPALRMHVLDIVAGLPTAARVHLRPLLHVLLNDSVLGLRAYAAGLLTQERGAVIARDEQAPGLISASFETGPQVEGSKDAGAVEGAHPDLGLGETARAAPTPAPPSAEDAAQAAQQQKQERLAQAQARFDQASQSAEAGDSARRSKLLLRARALCASASLRSHPDCVVLTAAATATLAGLYEQDARFTEAMSEYQLLLNNSSDNPAVVAHKRDAQKTTVRMGLRLGRVIVHAESISRSISR